MLRIKSKQIILLVGDVMLLLASLFIVLSFRWLQIPTSEVFVDHVYAFAPIFALIILLYYSFDFYDLSPFQIKLKQFSRITNIHILVAVIGFAYFYLTYSFSEITPKTILILLIIVDAVLSVIWRLFLVSSFLRPKNRIKTLLIASGDEYDELKEIVNGHDFYPFKFVSHLQINANEAKDTDLILGKLKKVLEENNISQVVVDIRNHNNDSLLPYLYNLATQRKIDVFDSVLVYQDILKKMPMQGIGHFWFFESVKLDVRAYELSKRILDMIIAIPAFLFWVVLHPFVYLAIRLDSKGDVFISQERYGLGGKVIKLYKYRTMTFSDKGKWLKDKGNTNKVTKVGYFLRKTRIDELPQVLAIFSGDLSFVGPRPDILALGGQLSAEIPYYMMRYTVRPGLSGWAQVNQDTPPQSTNETKVRLQYDLFYIKNRSIILDLLIVMRTFKVLILRTGM